MDPEGPRMTTTTDQPSPSATTSEPVLRATGLVKTYGHVVALDGVDLELYPGEVLAVIGDNGAGKSTLIKCLSGAESPNGGEINLDGQAVNFRSPQDARAHGIETVYQTLAVAPALDIASNLFLGRETRKPGVLGSVFRMLDKKHMRSEAARHMSELGVATLQNIGQAVESLSGGQRQAVAVARSAAFGSKVVILDEPTAALGVKEGNRVLQLIRDVRDRGLPVILISHNMPHVFEIADRIHIHRLGKRVAVVDPKEHSMHEVVGIMTGAVVHDIEHKGGSDEVVIPKDAPPPTPEEEQADAKRAE
jgi:fructose transport system ATP-binding protein